MILVKAEETMRREIDRIMEEAPGWIKIGNVWQTDLYADYRDELPFNDLYEIFTSEDPHFRFFEIMEEIYGTADYEERDRISWLVRRKLGERGGAFAVDEDGFFINCDTEELYQDLFDAGIFCCKYTGITLMESTMRKS